MGNSMVYLALLRGINVGGHHKIPMQELRKILSNSCLKNVKTYIQTGNICFESQENDKIKLEDIIKSTIASHFKFTIPVLVKTREDIKRILHDCPFSEEKKTNSYFVLLDNFPDKNRIALASEKKYLNEEYIIIKDCIYFFSANGYGKAKFNINYFEKKLNVHATARNYKTMLKLLSLSDTSE